MASGFNSSKFGGTQSAVCDICNRLRRQGSHAKCSEARQNKAKGVGDGASESQGK